MADHSASFVDVQTGLRIEIELRTTHRALAEYDRRLVLRFHEEVIESFDLTSDTGGYAAANLYGCGAGRFMIDSFSESVIVDTEFSTIQPGKCTGSRMYLGVFDGGGSEHWAFFPAASRKERALVMLGG